MSSFITLKQYYSDPFLATPEVYAIIFNEDGDAYSTFVQLFGNFNVFQVDDYDIPATGLDISGSTGSIWQIGFPVAITTPGTYTILWFSGDQSTHPGNNDVNGITSVRWTGTEIEAVNTGGSSASDVYHANIHYMFDLTPTPTDKYTVIWYKNGSRITSGITSPTIQVVSRDSGTNLISTTSMSEIGSTHIFKFDETGSLTTQSQPVIIVCEASIDGDTRSFTKQVGVGDAQGSGGSYTN